MWRIDRGEMAAVLLAMMVVTLSEAKCSDSMNVGTCPRVDPACLWCNGTAAYGPYCINVTDTATTSPDACRACSTHTNENVCSASFSSLSGDACVWCNPVTPVGPYCTAPGEANPNCAPCQLSPVTQYACQSPIDGSGNVCNPQCGEDVFTPITCSSSPSNCTSCSTVTSSSLCVNQPICSWCNVLVSEGPYCTIAVGGSVENANPNCMCSVTNATECWSMTTYNQGSCIWCAPTTVTTGPYCAVSWNPPAWCVNTCWNQVNETSCYAAAPCDWCGSADETGYYCALQYLPVQNPNCTIQCQEYTTMEECNNLGICQWCNLASTVGNHCRISSADCPRCSTHRDKHNCEDSLSPIPPDNQCVWCNPSTTTGAFCTSSTTGYAMCPPCASYTSRSECPAAVSGGPGDAMVQCGWCNANENAGPFCVGLSEGQNPNPNCPRCNTYQHQAACVGSNSATGFGCIWCNGSTRTGQYCSTGDGANCGWGCSTYTNQMACVDSSDGYGLCQWCNGTAVTGPFCTSAVNGKCPSCTEYTTSFGCQTSIDGLGACEWCSATATNGSFCTGKAHRNPLCPCRSSLNLLTCEASHSSVDVACHWCAEAEECFDTAHECSAFKCHTQKASDQQCTAHQCVWCSAMSTVVSNTETCRPTFADCPKCRDYLPQDCPNAVSPPFAVPSCFLCSPNNLASSACAAVVKSELDPSMCPPCNAYLTQTACTGSRLTMDPPLACKWCAVSYSCVPDTQGCGDCFSFLVPGNRLKPYWLSFVTVVKDYLVLLLAVAIAPTVKHLLRRWIARCKRSSTSADDTSTNDSGRHVVVYVAQDELIDEQGAVVGSLTDSLCRAITSLPQQGRISSVDDVMRRCVRHEVVWTSFVFVASPENSTRETDDDDRGDDGNPTSVPLLYGDAANATAAAGQWVNATYVSSKHLLQRAAYAAVLPPNAFIVTVGVLCAIAFAASVGVQTEGEFGRRRNADADLFGLNMYFFVLGYRVVNSGLQPTAALTLWQVIVALSSRLRNRCGRERRDAASVDPSIMDMLRTWNIWTRYIAAVQLLLFAPIWCVSLVGIAAYAWVLVLPVLVAIAASWFLRRLAAVLCSDAAAEPSIFSRNFSQQNLSFASRSETRFASATDTYLAMSTENGESQPVMSIQNEEVPQQEVDASSVTTAAKAEPLNTPRQLEPRASRWWLRTMDLEQLLSRLPHLSTRRRTAAALFVFLCERAIPVLLLSTALQTGYNYAALYVLAPGHMYCGYLDVIELEYGARSNVCLLQDVENILGDAAASVTSYLMPFA